MLVALNLFNVDALFNLPVSAVRTTNECPEPIF